MPPDGSFQEQHDDPTDEEAEITWESFEIGEMVDIDLDGKPIVNVLGDPIGPCSRDITCKRLSIAWNDSSYNLPLYSAYENTVCTAATALPSPNGTVTIAAHHLSCRTIQPAGPFKASAEFVRMRATFEIIPYLALGKYPFQHRVFNRGDNAFFLDSTSTRGLGRIGRCKEQPGYRRRAQSKWAAVRRRPWVQGKQSRQGQRHHRRHFACKAVARRRRHHLRHRSIFSARPRAYQPTRRWGFF